MTRQRRRRAMPFVSRGFLHCQKSTPSSDIRNQKRTKKKSLTTVQGLKKETLDLKKILSDLKKVFFNRKPTHCLTLCCQQYKCNGTIVDNEDCGSILQFSGDQRVNISTFLIETGLFRKDQIKIHGAI
eukprot:Selendium_serpulae@DN5268_c0_g1_i2.p1